VDVGGRRGRRERRKKKKRKKRRGSFLAFFRLP